MIPRPRSTTRPPRASSSLAGKVIWITGASSGIGRALALQLSREGARLVLSARSLERLREVRAQCPGETVAVPLDLARGETLVKRTRAAIASFGRIDMLINNAGIAVRDWALNTRPETDRRVMEVNYFGTVALTKALLPHLLERGSGRVVTVTSVSGKYGFPKGAAYAASKHALHGFFDSLRLELQDSGVGVTLIVPGLVRTGILDHALRGDGTPYEHTVLGQEEGIEAAACAAEILRALRRGKDEATVGLFRDEFTVLFYRWFPRTFYRVLVRHPIRWLHRVRAALRVGRRGAPGSGARRRAP